jgi:hypothetical protein
MSAFATMDAFDASQQQDASKPDQQHTFAIL